MKFLIFLSDFIMPLMIFYIVAYGMLMKRPIYDDFITGAKDGLKTVVGIMPTLIRSLRPQSRACTYTNAWDSTGKFPGICPCG